MKTISAELKTISAELLPMCDVAVEDARKFCGWMETQAARTNLDIKVLSYPRSCMARVAKGEKTVAMLPIQPVLMLESLAKDPEMSEWALTLSIIELDALTGQVMASTGICEAYLLTDMPKFVDTAISRGWTKCLHDPERKTWLMKKQIEPPKCE